MLKRFPKAASHPSLHALRWPAYSVLMCVVMLLSGLGQVAHAQPDGSILTVYAKPTQVEPGQSISFTVIAEGAGSYTYIDIDVPSELTISDDVDCTHSTGYCDGVLPSVLDAETNRLSVMAPGADFGPTVRVTVSFSVLVPKTVAPGTHLEINSTVKGLYNLYDPISATDKQVSTVVEVLDSSGRRVSPPTPTPEPAPALVPAPDNHFNFRFEIRQDRFPFGRHLIPGERYTFSVHQGFRNVAGTLSLEVTFPNAIAIVDKPICAVADAAGPCEQLTVTEQAGGTTTVEVLGESSIGDPLRVDIVTMVSQSVAVGTLSEITGRYTVTDPSTGSQIGSNIRNAVYFADVETAIAAAMTEGTLQATFADAAPGFSHCVALSQDGRWGLRYWVCDNDTTTLDAPGEGWAILTDANPEVHEIEVVVSTGAYYLIIDEPSAVRPLHSADGIEVVVPPEGTEIVIDPESP